MRVALYIRDSSLTSIAPKKEHQLQDLRQVAETRGWIIVEEYLEGPFRSRGARKSFQQLMRDAKWKKFEIVLFWSLERFCPENLTSTLHYLQTLISYGINYLSYSESWILVAFIETQ